LNIIPKLVLKVYQQSLKKTLIYSLELVYCFEGRGSKYLLLLPDGKLEESMIREILKERDFHPFPPAPARRNPSKAVKVWKYQRQIQGYMKRTWIMAGRLPLAISKKVYYLFKWNGEEM